jgi:hypothetical protein
VSRRAWGGLLAAAVVVAVALSPLASSLPDGLDWVAGRLGFAHRAAPMVTPPLAGYSPALPVPGAVRTAGAGLAGVAVAFALGAGVAWLLRRRRADGGASPRES